MTKTMTTLDIIYQIIDIWTGASMDAGEHVATPASHHGLMHPEALTREARHSESGREDRESDQHG